MKKPIAVSHLDLIRVKITTKLEGLKTSRTCWTTKDQIGKNLLRIATKDPQIWDYIKIIPGVRELEVMP